MTAVDAADLAETVRRAQAGDRAALEAVVRAIQDDVFHLALRMFGDPDDARDASQEALVRIVTKLGSFRGESAVQTWVYRVATNALLDARPRRLPERSFAQLGAELDGALAAAGAAAATSGPVDARLIDEAKLVCTHGMLMCLDRAHRVAYILGEIMELPGDEAAAILDITPAAFRKRLSRARDDMEAFVASRCGIANPANRCRCATLVPAVVAGGLVDPARPRYGRLPVVAADRLRTDIDELRTAAELFRRLPAYGTPEDFAAYVRDLLSATPEA